MQVGVGVSILFVCVFFCYLKITSLDVILLDEIVTCNVEFCQVFVVLLDPYTVQGCLTGNLHPVKLDNL